jgi:cytosine/adenosine deaminase-related metal-dependent hydrolase
MGSRRDSRRKFLKGSIGLAALSGCGTMAVQEPADLLVTNARVNTLDPKRPRAEAIAIKGDRIVAVGSAAELEPYRNMNTKVIDAGVRRTGCKSSAAGLGHNSTRSASRRWMRSTRRPATRPA